MQAPNLADGIGAFPIMQGSYKQLPTSCLAVLHFHSSMVQGSDEVVEMNKSIRLKMFLPSQRLHVVYPHQRSQEFFTNTPGQAGLPHACNLSSVLHCCTAGVTDLCLHDSWLATAGWPLLL